MATPTTVSPLARMQQYLADALKRAGVSFDLKLEPDFWCSPEDTPEVGSLSLDGGNVTVTRVYGKAEDGSRIPQWLVSRAVFIPGTRYHPDGSGTPDDVDVQDVLQTSDPNAAVLTAIQTLIEMRLHGWVPDYGDEHE